MTYNALDFEWWINLLVADGRQSSKPGFDDYRSETRMLLPIKRFK